MVETALEHPKKSPRGLTWYITDTPDITCPTVLLIGLLDKVTGSGNAINAISHLKKGQVQIISDPWGGHGSTSYPTQQAFRKAKRRALNKQTLIDKPAK